MPTVYSNHLNTGFCSVRFSNGLSPQASKMMVDHLKTGHFCPVFEWFGFTDHSKTGPIVNQTHLDHSKSGLVRYSDGYCTYLVGCQFEMFLSNPRKIVWRFRWREAISGHRRTSRTKTGFLDLSRDCDPRSALQDGCNGGTASTWKHNFVIFIIFNANYLSLVSS